MSHTVTLPDASTQHQKTPAWVRVFETVLDAQDQPMKVARRHLFTEGTGASLRVLRWHEAVDRVRDYVETHTLAELKAVYETIAGEAYAGVGSKKGVLKAVLALWFGFDEDLTLEAMKAWMLAHLQTDVGEWGLGCPAGCGRHWAFAVKNGSLRFSDPAAYTGPQAEILDEWAVTDPETGVTTHYYEIRHWEGEVRVVTEVPVNQGYLHVDPVARRFTCDRCGASIQVVPS